MKSAREMILEFAANPPVYPTDKNGISAEKQQEIHGMIQRGDIPLGPQADHSAPIEDIRYVGPDAEELGLEIIAKRNGGTNGSLPELRELPSP